MIAINQNNNTHLLSVAEDAAKEAGALLYRLFQKPRTIEHKGLFDLVTDADKAANALLETRLQTAFPESLVITEEDPHLKERLSLLTHKDLVWFVDPLDGTTNYAKGIPHSAVSIAAYRPKEGLVLVGVVYDPWRNECFTAILGQGARLNGESIHVSSTSFLQEAVLATGFGYDKGENLDNNLVEFDYLCKEALGIRRFGAASLDLAWVAAGRFDAYWEQHLKAWDMAAGMLLVSEAGGQVSTYQGHNVDPLIGHILASNLAIHPTLVSTLTKIRLQAGLSKEPHMAVE